MTIKAEAIYENGVLKLSAPLPFQEHQKVELVINGELSWAERTAGILRWNGETEDLRRIAEDDEVGILGTR